MRALQSPWLTEAEPGRAPALGEIRADVAVIGAGITGVTVALLLAEAGMDVVVCEAQTVASGVSGANTAKVSALQATIYSELTSRHGSETAAAYARASVAGVELVATLAAQHAPDCGLSRRPAATVGASAGQIGLVRRELIAAKAAGLDVRSAVEVDAPLPCRSAVCLDDQLSLHPVRYVRAPRRPDPGPDRGPRGRLCPDQVQPARGARPRADCRQGRGRDRRGPAAPGGYRQLGGPPARHRRRTEAGSQAHRDLP